MTREFGQKLRGRDADGIGEDEFPIDDLDGSKRAAQSFLKAGPCGDAQLEEFEEKVDRNDFRVLE